MLKFFAKFFEAMCTILMVVFFIVFTAIGAFAGRYLGLYLGESTMLYSVLLGVAGFAIGFFFNIFTFGLFSQIVEIRKNLEMLNNK